MPMQRSELELSLRRMYQPFHGRAVYVAACCGRVAISENLITGCGTCQSIPETTVCRSVEELIAWSSTIPLPS